MPQRSTKDTNDTMTQGSPSGRVFPNTVGRNMSHHPRQSAFAIRVIFQGCVPVYEYGFVSKYGPDSLSTVF